MTTPETPEKWIEGTVVDDEGVWRNGKVLNPAWASHMEALVKEFAEEIVGRARKESHAEFSLNGKFVVCTCGAVSCPVLKAQNVLEGK